MIHSRTGLTPMYAHVEAKRMQAARSFAEQTTNFSRDLKRFGYFYGSFLARGSHFYEILGMFQIYLGREIMAGRFVVGSSRVFSGPRERLL